MINDICVDYGYQLICGGDPKWPSTASDLGEQDKDRINELCLSCKNQLPGKATLLTLSKEPEKFIPLLSRILSEYEEEHKNHKSYDVRRLSLPRLFGLFPSPSLHFRSITMSAKAVSSFLKKRCPTRGYTEELNMFTEIINFKKLRYER